MLKRHLDYGNQAFVLECYEALYQLGVKRSFSDLDRKVGCVYHVHKKGEGCGG